MTAERELDAQIAAWMGDDFGEKPTHQWASTWDIDDNPSKDFYCRRCWDFADEQLPGPCVTEAAPYSTGIVIAWRVWEKLPEPKRLTEGESGANIYSLARARDDAVLARFYVLCGGASYGAQTDISYKFVGWGATPAEAICRAALAAVSQPSTESAAASPDLA